MINDNDSDSDKRRKSGCSYERRGNEQKNDSHNSFEKMRQVDAVCVLHALCLGCANRRGRADCKWQAAHLPFVVTFFTMRIKEIAYG